MQHHLLGSSLLFSVVPEAELADVLAELREARDRAGARETTKIFVADAEAAD